MALGNFLRATAELLSSVIHIYLIIIIVRSLLSWLRGVQMPQGIYTLQMILRKLTDPVFKLVYKYLPFTVAGGIDLSPIVIILALTFIDNFLVETLRQAGIQMIRDAHNAAVGGYYQ